jgi:hypothetical protein
MDESRTKMVWLVLKVYKIGHLSGVVVNKDDVKASANEALRCAPLNCNPGV